MEIKVLAQLPEGKQVMADVLDLDEQSFRKWIISRLEEDYPKEVYKIDETKVDKYR